MNVVDPVSRVSMTSSVGLTPFREYPIRLWAGNIVLDGSNSVDSVPFRVRVTCKEKYIRLWRCKQGTGVLEPGQLHFIHLVVPEKALPSCILRLWLSNQPHFISLFKLAGADLYYWGYDTSLCPVVTPCITPCESNDSPTPSSLIGQIDEQLDNDVIMEEEEEANDVLVEKVMGNDVILEEEEGEGQDVIMEGKMYNDVILEEDDEEATLVATPVETTTPMISRIPKLVRRSTDSVSRRSTDTVINHSMNTVFGEALVDLLAPLREEVKRESQAQRVSERSVLLEYVHQMTMEIIMREMGRETVEKEETQTEGEIDDVIDRDHGETLDALVVDGLVKRWREHGKKGECQTTRQTTLLTT